MTGSKITLAFIELEIRQYRHISSPFDEPTLRAVCHYPGFRSCNTRYVEILGTLSNEFLYNQQHRVSPDSTAAQFRFDHSNSWSRRSLHGRRLGGSGLNSSCDIVQGSLCWNLDSSWVSGRTTGTVSAHSPERAKTGWRVMAFAPRLSEDSYR